MAASTNDELNLVPYMDVIMTLILAMVVLTSTLLDTTLAAARVEAPPLGPGGAAQVLSVAIAGDGFTVQEGGGAVALARVGGVWPYSALTSTLRGLRDAGEPTTTLTLRADPAIPLSVVVAAMDAARKDEAGPLYPSVTLAVAAR